MGVITEEEKKELMLLIKEGEGIYAKAKREGRHSLTAEEQKRANEIIARAEELRDKLPALSDDKVAKKWEAYKSASAFEPIKLDPADGGWLGGDGWEPSSDLARNRQASNPRSYRSLFCRSRQDPTPSHDGWKDFAEFATAIKLGLNDERVQRSLVEGVPSDGGFAVPSAISAEIFDASLEDEIVRPMALIVPMKTDERKIPATTIGSHDSNLYGGVVGYWQSEGGTMTQAEPTFRSIKLKAQKLTVYGIASSEWEEDVPGSLQALQQTFIKGLGWYLDRAFIKGSGAGQPLGFLNSPCLIAVDKAGGQDADTITYPNLCNMLARLHPACYAKSVWVAHISTIPELLQLSHIVGTGGTLVPVLKDAGGGKWNLLTRPVIFTEKMEVLGDQGDIALCDFTQYAIGMRKELRFETSIHVKFASDEIAHRCIARVDGQPMWDEALTLEDGTTTVSPFVTLAERT